MAIGYSYQANFESMSLKIGPVANAKFVEAGTMLIGEAALSTLLFC